MNLPKTNRNPKYQIHQNTMKTHTKHTLTGLLLGGILAISAAQAQNTLTVDNRPGSAAMFDNFADAYAAAESGDTIFLAGSSTSYGTNHEITKRIHLRGPGYLKPELGIEHANRESAQIWVTFRQGSDGSSAKGIHFRPPTFSVWVDVSTAAIHFDQILMDGGSNSSWIVRSPTKIQRSYFRLSGSLESGAGGTIIENSRVFSITRNSSAHLLIRHCHLRGSWGVGGTSPQRLEIENSTGDDFATAIDDAIIRNSILNTPFNGTGSGNLTEVPMTGEGGVYESIFHDRFILREDSPAKNAAPDGTDIGPTGGSRPLVPGGVGAMPRITVLNVPEAVTDSTGLEFEVGAKAATQP